MDRECGVQCRPTMITKEVAWELNSDPGNFQKPQFHHGLDRLIIAITLLHCGVLCDTATIRSKRFSNAPRIIPGARCLINDVNRHTVSGTPRTLARLKYRTDGRWNEGIGTSGDWVVKSFRFIGSDANSAKKVHLAVLLLGALILQTTSGRCSPEVDYNEPGNVGGRQRSDLGTWNRRQGYCAVKAVNFGRRVRTWKSGLWRPLRSWWK